MIARVKQKTASFGSDYTGSGPIHADNEDDMYKINPNTVAALFEHWVMPLTKDVEVQYLLRRLEWDAWDAASSFICVHVKSEKDTECFS